MKYESKVVYFGALKVKVVISWAKVLRLNRFCVLWTHDPLSVKSHLDKAVNKVKCSSMLL